MQNSNKIGQDDIGQINKLAKNLIVPTEQN